MGSLYSNLADQMEALRAENAALRDALEVIASPSGIEPRLWAAYVARQALGQRITPFTLEWLESEDSNRITMRSENAAIRAQVANTVQTLRGCLESPERRRSPVIVFNKQVLLQAVIEPLEKALAAAKPAAQEGKEAP